jgi:hypothetical protein
LTTTFQLAGVTLSQHSGGDGNMGGPIPKDDDDAVGAGVVVVDSLTVPVGLNVGLAVGLSVGATVGAEVSISPPHL